MFRCSQELLSWPLEVNSLTFAVSWDLCHEDEAGESVCLTPSPLPTQSDFQAHESLRVADLRTVMPVFFPAYPSPTTWCLK